MRDSLRALKPEYFALGLGAALVATFPLVGRLNSHMVGSELVGAYSHAWKYWWVRHALLELGVNPAHSELLAFPQGLAVGRHMACFLNGFLALPVTLAAGPAAAFNAVCLVSTAGGCWAAALLAGRMGLGRGCASLVGLSWALAPHFLGYFMGGALENLANPWIPLTLLGLVELFGEAEPAMPAGGRRRVGMALLCAVGLFLTALTSWHQGLVLGLLAGWFLLLQVPRLRSQALKPGLWALGGLALGSAGVLVAARGLLPDASTANQPSVEALVTAQLMGSHVGWLRELEEGAVAMSGSLWLNNHLLLSLLLLACLGLATRGGRLWALLALPYLADLVLPDEISSLPVIGERSLPGNLYTAFGSLLGSGERRIALLHILLSLAAGHGLAWLSTLLRAWGWRGLARAAVPLTLGIWAAELLLAGPVRLPVPSFEVRDPAYAHHLAQAAPGAVVVLPLFVEESRSVSALGIKAHRSAYIFDQTIHGHPLLNAVGSHLSFSASSLPLRDSLLTSLASLEMTGRRWRELPTDWTPERLVEEGFRWIVLQRTLYPESTGPAAQRLLEAALGEPLELEGEVFLFELASPGQDGDDGARGR